MKRRGIHGGTALMALCMCACSVAGTPPTEETPPRSVNAQAPAPVVVTNGASSPIPVTVGNSEAREAVYLTAAAPSGSAGSPFTRLGDPTGNTATGGYYMVPPGKQLVIEHVDVKCWSQSGEPPAAGLHFVTHFDRVQAGDFSTAVEVGGFAIVLAAQGRASGGLYRFWGSAPFALRLDAGTLPRVEFDTSDSSCTGNVSGYHVNAQ